MREDVLSITHPSILEGVVDRRILGYIYTLKLLATLLWFLFFVCWHYDR
ncbi:hypothetical protein [Fischerella thermalis]|nr:hypothetical protein [Fischerella thermalis]